MGDQREIIAPLSRRQALIGGASVAAGVLLAACGGSGGSTPSSAGNTTTPIAARKRGGTFTWGAQDASATSSVDPAHAFANADQQLLHCIYDRLVENNAKAVPVIGAGLAETLEPNADASEWTLRLRGGVTFHNGKPLTVDDVIFSFRRLIAAKGSLAQSLLTTVNPNGFTKLDKLTLRMKLRVPNAFLADSLAHATVCIMPTGFDPKHPIGTGAFKYVSFSPGVQFVGARNANYWRAGQPYLDKIIQTGFADPVVARFNALQSGTIDAVPALDFSQVAVAKGMSNMNTIMSTTGAYTPITMRVDQPPFNDPRVLEAFKLIPDRPQLVEHAYSGYGRIANDLGWPQDPAYNSSIPQRVQDIARAKALLKAAGHENLALTFYVQTGGVGASQAAQVFAQQASAAGVKINVTVPNLTDYYAKDYTVVALSNDVFNTEALSTVMRFSLLPGAPYNEDHWNSKRAAALFAQASALPDAAKRKPILDELQLLIREQSGWIVWGYSDLFDAVNSKFTGVEPDALGMGLNGGRIREISLA